MFTNQQWQNNSFCFLRPDQITTAYHHGGTSMPYWDSYWSFLLHHQETLANQVQDLRASIDELQKELGEMTLRMQQQDEDKGSSKRLKGKNGTKGKKTFSKDLKCPF